MNAPAISSPLTPRVSSPRDVRGQRAIEVIKGTSEAVDNLNRASMQLRLQTQNMSTVASKSSEDPALEFQRLRRLLRQHDRDHTKRMAELQEALTAEVKAGAAVILEEVRREIPNTIEQEVRAAVEEQIQDHIPVSLIQQAKETKEQLDSVKASLQNSKSRIVNAELDMSNLYDPLAVVLTPEGKRSRYWPADLCSLLAYSLESARLLVKDFGLVDSDQLNVNFQRFLIHIGTHIDLAIPHAKD